MRDPRREPGAWRVCPRGVSRAAGVRRVRVRVRAGGRAGGRGTARWRPRGPYCRSSWWIMAFLGCRFGLCRGWWMVPWIDVQGAAGACGLGLSLEMWAWGRLVPRGRSGWALVASVGAAVRVCAGGPSGGICVGLAVGRTGGLWCGWGSGLACLRAACRWPRVDASGGVRGYGPGSPAGPGPGPVCGRMVPRGCSGWALVVAVFVWHGTFPLPAGDAWCFRVAVAAWCCGGCRSAARLAARSCRGLCGVPAPDGAGAPAVLVASVVCGQCGEWAVASGVEVDGLEDVETVGLRGALAQRCRGACTCSPGCGGGARPGLGGDGRNSPGGGGGAVVSGTPGRHPGHCCIAVPARLLRWDEWLVGARRHWNESAGEGYPPPR